MDSITIFGAIGFWCVVIALVGIVWLAFGTSLLSGFIALAVVGALMFGIAVFVKVME